MKLGQKINNFTAGPKVSANRHLIWLVTFIVVAFIAWAAVAQLDEIVRGTGKVVPTMKNQIIQNLEGGIIDQIYVTEGDIVESDQIVVTMDKTRFKSAYQELLDEKWALSLKLERLEAETHFGAQFTPDPEIAQLAPGYAASETQLFVARQQELAQTLKNLSAAVDLKEQEVEMFRAMAEREVVPKIELVRLEQVLVDFRSRFEEVQSKFETARAQEFAETLVKLRQIEEKIRSREDQLLRTNVRSPIRGVVNRVLATTVGGVAKPGDPLVEVLSLEDELRIEGRVVPRDIGFVYVGMPATIKFTAFDFSIYGTLKGRVVHVGADTVIDKEQREPMPYYEVYIKLEDTFLKGPSGQVEIRPGMQAEIELDSGQKTVLQYILKPLFKTTEALSER